MRTRNMPIAIGVLVLAGCAPAPEPAAIPKFECPRGPDYRPGPLRPCDGSPRLTINVQPNPPQANPPNCELAPGTRLEAGIVPTGQPPGSVVLFAKFSNADGGGLDNWLTNDNSHDGDAITIEVPDEPYFDGICESDEDGQYVDCDFCYAIIVDGKDVVDPRFTVRK